jgi:hypothetical protein
VGIENTIIRRKIKMDAKEFNQMLRNAGVDIGKLKKMTSKEQLQVIKSDAPLLYYKILEQLKVEGKLEEPIEQQVERFVEQVNPGSSVKDDRTIKPGDLDSFVKNMH